MARNGLGSAANPQTRFRAESGLLSLHRFHIPNGMSWRSEVLPKSRENEFGDAHHRPRRTAGAISILGADIDSHQKSTNGTTEVVMYTKFALLLLAVAAVFFAIGRTTAQDQAKLNQQTMENLSTAMHGEAFAFSKYMLYAQHARQSGNTELADLFQKAAHTERFEHFAAEARLAGLVGNDADNLNDAIKGESYEVETMYLGFAKDAAAAGDKAAAARFEEIRRDEIGHRDAFKAALAKLQESQTQGQQ